ncbi:unnamed protein product [Enterobius vermicularis]|uniref:Aggrecan core protein n=1 Tax=Enterobius vermicularis TaxID=51028 RepID=A0A0N4VLW7_ENTVE|nr:unnamed protein product [Enterobius vermicularis]
MTRTHDEIRVLRGGEIQQHYLSNIEKPEEEPEKIAVQPVSVQDDASWLTQTRVVVSDVVLPQPSKIAIPEFQETVRVQPTVIVPKPAQRTRVDWNEFPEEEVKERIQAPRLRLQEWWPEKQAEITENRVGRTTYRPGRINRTWPPPQDENQPPPMDFRPTRTAEDNTWIHEGNVEMEKTNAWVKVTSNEILKEKVWPPQEPEIQTGFIEGGARLPTVQWPPPEFEQQVQQEVEILQTRLPIKPQQRQWPPPPPQYQGTCFQ